MPISENTAVRYLKEMNFRDKRYRYGLRKRNQKAFERPSKVNRELGRLDHEQRCELLYFDESGFNPNLPVQYAGPGLARLALLNHLRIGSESTCWGIAPRRTVNLDYSAAANHVR